MPSTARRSSTAPRPARHADRLAFLAGQPGLCRPDRHLSATTRPRRKELLKEAGFENGFKATLKLPPVGYARDGGQIIASQLRDVGIDLEIIPVEWAEWLDQVFKDKDYDLTIVSHTEPNDIDIYARKDYYFNYDNPAFDKVIDELNLTSDDAKRTELYQQAQKILADDAVNGFLFELPKIGVWDAKLEGLWENSPIQANDLTKVKWVDWTPSGGTDLRPFAELRPRARRSRPGAAALPMTAYLAKRLLIGLATLVVASVVVFAVLEVLPGDPARLMLGMNASPRTRRSAARPARPRTSRSPLRYLAWIGGLLRARFRPLLHLFGAGHRPRSRERIGRLAAAGAHRAGPVDR